MCGVQTYFSQIVGPYRIQHVEYGLAAILTNKNQQGAYRGFGAEVSNWVLERLVDLAAQELGLDRVEIRRRNLIGPGSFPYRTPTGNITEQAIMANTLFAGGMILLLFYFVYLAAHHRKNWPRWVLSIALALSVVSLVLVIGERGLELDSAIEIVSCALTALGLYYSVTGDAKDWFNA